MSIKNFAVKTLFGLVLFYGLTLLVSTISWAFLYLWAGSARAEQIFSTLEAEYAFRLLILLPSSVVTGIFLGDVQNKKRHVAIVFAAVFVSDLLMGHLFSSPPNNGPTWYQVMIGVSILFGLSVGVLLRGFLKRNRITKMRA